VPVLYRGPFGAVEPITDIPIQPWRDALEDLRLFGSRAEPGFMKPEGIVVFMHASRTMHKVTLEGDEQPKGAAR
jgi:hypothetical protein